MMCGMLQKVMLIGAVQIKCNCYEIVGFRKKLEALAKQKDCELVGQWQRIIINHMYWCVASTPDGSGELVKAKWLSLEHHIHNIHTRHSTLFPMCAHGELGLGRKKWFRRRKICIH